MKMDLRKMVEGYGPDLINSGKGPGVGFC
jgi:hypothetical protein